MNEVKELASLSNRSEKEVLGVLNSLSSSASDVKTFYLAVNRFPDAQEDAYMFNYGTKQAIFVSQPIQKKEK